MTRRLLGLMAAICLASAFRVAAQPIPLPDHLWLSNGFGITSEGLGFVGSWSAVFAERHLLSLRATGAVEVPLLLSGDVVPEAVIDVGMLFGRAWHDELAHAHFSLAAGLAYVEGNRRGTRIENPRGSDFCIVFCQYERHSFRTVGIPFEARVMTTPWRYLGVGFSVFGNANLERSYVGGALQLHVGILR